MYYQPRGACDWLLSVISTSNLRYGVVLMREVLEKGGKSGTKRASRSFEIYLAANASDARPKLPSLPSYYVVVLGDVRLT